MELPQSFRNRILRLRYAPLRMTKEEHAESAMVRLLAARPSHAQGGAKVRYESFTKFDGITGGLVRPFGAVEARELGKIFEVNTGSAGALQ